MRGALCFLLCAALLAGSAFAVDTDALTQALPDSAAAVLGDADVMDAAGGGLFSAVWQWLCDHARAAFAEAFREAGTALCAALLCSAAGTLAPGGETPGYVLLGGALAVFGACAGDMRSYLGEVTAALGDLSIFSRTLLPTITAAAAAAGRGAEAAARYAVSALFIDLLISLGTGFVLPAVTAFAAVSTADAALPEGALDGPAKLLSWLCKALLTGMTTVFTLAVTLSGVVAGGAGRLAGAAAKAAISAALPVVGSILADAADAYLAGAELVRGAVGIFGLAAVLAICAGPALKLGLRYILFRAAAALAAPFAERRLAALLDRLASACGLALGLLGSAGAMLFVAVSIGMGALSG